MPIRFPLGEDTSYWASELDGVLWSYRTTPRRPSGQSPFSLAYRLEAMAASESGTPTLGRYMMTDDLGLNDQLLRYHNDFTEELRDQVLVWIQNYQNAASKYYNQNENAALTWTISSFAKSSVTLRARWEGPYMISKVVYPRVYQLMTIKLEEVQNPWNAVHLKKCYY